MSDTHKNSTWETVKTVFWALLIAAGIRSLAFEPFNIPSGSMKPTLLVGDYVFVSKYAYGYSHFSFPFSPPVFEGRIFDEEPERGDVVVFRKPTQPDIDYIKRLIGMPGDRIQLRKGRIYINGVGVKRERIGDFYDKIRKNGPPLIRAMWKETLPNGVSYQVADDIATDPNQDEYDTDNTRVFVVPPGHYFMIGDNRDNSVDSRVHPLRGGVGFVPAENLIGRAEVIFLSTDYDGLFIMLWESLPRLRLDRIFTSINGSSDE